MIELVVKAKLDVIEVRQSQVGFGVCFFWIMIRRCRSHMPFETCPTLSMTTISSSSLIMIWLQLETSISSIHRRREQQFVGFSHWQKPQQWAVFLDGTTLAPKRLCQANVTPYRSFGSRNMSAIESTLHLYPMGTTMASQ